MTASETLLAAEAALSERRQTLRGVLTGGMAVIATAGDASDAPTDVESWPDLVNRIGQELEQIDDALDRVRDGRYGVCDSCGEAIHPDRLEIMPHAAYCVHCQGDADRVAERARLAGTRRHRSKAKQAGQALAAHDNDCLIRPGR